MKRKRLIVDLSSVLWTCLLAGKDTEFGYIVKFTPEGKDEPKDVHVNTAQYGYENVINHFIAVMEKLDIAPMDMILVVEGMSSKMMRQNILPQYKAGRDRPDESYTEFQKLREMIVTSFVNLGAIAVQQDGVEADDVIAYLAMHLDGEKIIDSNDGDVGQLISDGTTPTTGVSQWKQSKGELLTANPYCGGAFSCKHILTYKSIVGDTGDKIPGAKGFGETTWLNLLCNFDEASLDILLQLIIDKQLDRLQEDYDSFPNLKKIVENKDIVYKSYQCARLYPHLVNTVRKPLQWTPGMVRPTHEFDDKRLKPFAGQVRLIHAANYKQAIDFLKQHIDATPFFSFDIETSSNDTADQWLETAKTKSNESKDAEGVDVYGAELTSFSLTFGRNCQYTFFFTVDHVETEVVKNISKGEAKAVLEMLPKSKVKAIQNVSFELPVVMENLGPLEEAA